MLPYQALVSLTRCPWCWYLLWCLAFPQHRTTAPYQNLNKLKSNFWNFLCQLSKTCHNCNYEIVKFRWQTLKEIPNFCIIWYPLKKFYCYSNNRKLSDLEGGSKKAGLSFRVILRGVRPRLNPMFTRLGEIGDFQLLIWVLNYLN